MVWYQLVGLSWDLQLLTNEPVAGTLDVKLLIKIITAEQGKRADYQTSRDVKTSKGTDKQSDIEVTADPKVKNPLIETDEFRELLECRMGLMNRIAETLTSKRTFSMM